MTYRLPQFSDFPAGTEFLIKEFDVPLVQTPHNGKAAYFNWFGGTPKPYDVTLLRVDNNWPADSFDEWLAVLRASLK